MQLKTFISQVLTELFEGVEEAQQQLEEGRTKIYPRLDRRAAGSDSGLLPAEKGETLVDFIDFDVAVYASEGTEQGANAGITVAHMFQAGGGMSSENTSGSISSVRFRVPIKVAQAPERNS